MTEHEIDNRLKAADPAHRYNGEPTSQLLHEATKTSKPRRRQLLSFQNSLQRSLAIGAAALLAVTISIPAVFHFGGNAALIQVAISGDRGGAPQAGNSEAKIAGNGVRDMMCLGPCGFGGYKYVNDGLSSEESSAHIYEMVAKGQVSELGRILGDQFDQKGNLRKSATEGQDYYYFGDIDPYASEGDASSYWNSPQVTIFWNSSNPSWSYNNPKAYVQYACEAAEGEGKNSAGDEGANSSSSSGGSEAVSPGSPGEPNPEPCKVVIPEGAKQITASEAKQFGIKLFTRLGYEVGTTAKRTNADYLKLVVRSDDWNVTVTGFLVVGGYVTNQQISLNWDANTGLLANAYGMFSSAKDMGVYKVISPAAALPRLNNFAWGGDFWADWDTFRWSENLNGGLMRGVDDGIVMPDIAPDPKSTDTPDATTGSNPESTPEPIVLKLSRSELTLMGVWSTNSVSWLVPGYLFFDDSGYVGSSLAVEDGVVAIPDYSDSGVMPMTK